MEKILFLNIILSIIILIIVLAVMILSNKLSIKIASVTISIALLLFNITDFCKFIPGVVPNIEDVINIQELENIQTGDIEGEVLFSSEELKESKLQTNYQSWIYEDKNCGITIGLLRNMGISVVGNDKCYQMIAEYELNGNQLHVYYTNVFYYGKDWNVINVKKKATYYIKFSEDGKKCYFSFDGIYYIPLVNVDTQMKIEKSNLAST